MATAKLRGKEKKAAAAAATPARKSSRLSEQAAKRKATEDVSPAAVKKRKPEEEDAAAVTATPTKTSGKKQKKPTKTAETAAKKAEKEEAEVEKEAEKEAEKEEVTEEAEEEDDDTTKALVLDLDEEDEEDEEDIEAGGASLFQTGQDVGTAPVPKTTTSSRAKGHGAAKALTSEDAPTPGAVVYVGRIPHGFFEHEMRAYFEQFGDIARLRLSRNRKTGASKHYAFIEFADPDVAAIVAQTMDNYLLFGHLLRCSVVAAERVPPGLFKGANRRFKPVPWNRMAGRALEKPRPEAAWSLKIAKETARRKQRAAKLQAKLGYAYEAPALKSVESVDAVEAAAAPAAIEDTPAEEAKEEVVAVEDAAPAPEADKDAAPAAKTPKAKKSKAKKSKA